MNVPTLLALYRSCAKTATANLIRSWTLLPASALALLSYVLAQGLFGGLGMVGALLLGIASLCLLTLYYGWLRAASDKERLNLSSLKEFDGGLFNDILNVAFFLFPASLTISLLAKSPDSQGLAACASLGLLILCNPIPEMIYRARTSGLEAIVSSFQFVQDHWIEWFLPVVIIAAPILLLDFATALVILSSSDQFIPMHTLMFNLGLYLGGSKFVGIILAVIICNWLMLFRAELFNELSTKAHRARQFQHKAGKK